MKLVFIIVEDGRRVFQSENFAQALAEFIGSAEKVRDMNGDVEASLTVTWLHE